MKLIIDNANIDDIRSMYEYFPMDGVTCNPTILAKEKRPPYEVLKEIRDFIEEGELHVQVLNDKAEGMVAVSYTHLDVYKRQPWACRKMSRSSTRCFLMPSRKPRRRLRAITSVSVRTCWSTTRL